MKLSTVNIPYCEYLNRCPQKTNTRITGSAPDISGKGIVNPVAAILSVAMLLKYSLNMLPEASAVEEAVRRTINRGIRTPDIGGSATTGEVGDAVAAELAMVLQERP